MGFKSFEVERNDLGEFWTVHASKIITPEELELNSDLVQKVAAMGTYSRSLLEQTPSGPTGSIPLRCTGYEEKQNPYLLFDLSDEMFTRLFPDSDITEQLRPSNKTELIKSNQSYGNFWGGMDAAVSFGVSPHFFHIESFFDYFVKMQIEFNSGLGFLDVLNNLTEYGRVRREIYSVMMGFFNDDILMIEEFFRHTLLRKGFQVLLGDHNHLESFLTTASWGYPNFDPDGELVVYNEIPPELVLAIVPLSEWDQSLLGL